MTNSHSSHSQFPSSQIRRTAQLQTAVAGHPYLNQRVFHPLAQPSTTDLPAAIQRPRSAAPSRNVSTTSLSTLGKGGAAKEKDREYWIPEYLEGTSYGVLVSQWREQHVAAAGNPSPATGPSSTAMRREASTSQTVPSSRNPSPHNHPYAVGYHRGVAFDFSSSTHPTDPPFLPSRLNERDRSPIVEVLNDGLEARFSGPPKGGDADAGSVRAEHPIPYICGVYYYEATVLSRGTQGHIGIGFCRSTVTLNKLPGWEPESWGYHGDDGYTFCCQGVGKTYGPTFSTGDVVGCCINFRKGVAFYTKNGVELDTAFRDLTFDTPGKAPTKGDFWPAVGFRTPGEHLRLNFGQKPFVFDIDAYVMREKMEVLTKVLSSPTIEYPTETQSVMTIQNLIASYMAHNGYIGTARGFAKDVEEEERAFTKSENTLTNGSPSPRKGLLRLEEGEEKEVSRRQQIRKAILCGDIDRAISLTQTFYPTVLEKNEPIYFRLRARKFVEMMRICADGTTPTKSIDSPDTDKMAIDDDEQVDDEVHMTDVTPTPHNTKFVIDDDEDSEDETVGPTKAARKEAGLLTEALAYGQQLHEDYRDDPREDVKRVLGEAFSLLAYTDPRGSVVGHLLEESGRREVAEELNSAILASMGKSPIAPLEMAVRHASALVKELVENASMNASLINVKDDFVV